jgi:hypothetical protein
MTDGNQHPPRPQRPDPNECCGGGCVPCILDYYYEELEKWEAKYGKQAQSKGFNQGKPADK